MRIHGKSAVECPIGAGVRVESSEFESRGSRVGKGREGKGEAN